MKLYEVDIADTNVTNTTNAPPHADWAEVEYIDPYKCFDGKVGTLTISSGTNSSIIIETSTTSLVNGAAFLAIDAETLTFEIEDSVEGVVYTETRNLLEDVENWWQYFFAPYDQLTDLVLADLPTYPGADMTLTLSRSSGVVKIGEVVYGQLKTIGDTQFGASAGIIDYSKKTTDDNGNYQVTAGRFSKRANFDVQIETSSFSVVNKYLSSIRSTPCVFIGDPGQDALIVYGFFRNFSTVLANPALSQCTIDVEGLG
jgi:hypothetical protein